jgi:RNA polymerase sigma-70 factor (ECF subfamily)
MEGQRGRMTRPDLQETFQKLVEEHKRILYKVSNAYCKDRDSRDDLAQEILFQLWRSFPRFDGSSRFSTWMYRVALNVAISFYRSESTRTRHVISDEQRLLESADESQSQPEDVRLLYRFIDLLDPLNKALILLYLDQNSYQEIAAALGITETNVATKINRLKTRMRREFSGTRQA